MRTLDSFEAPLASLTQRVWLSRPLVRLTHRLWLGKNYEVFQTILTLCHGLSMLDENRTNVWALWRIGCVMDIVLRSGICSRQGLRLIFRTGDEGRLAS